MPCRAATLALVAALLAVAAVAPVDGALSPHHPLATAARRAAHGVPPFLRRLRLALTTGRTHRLPLPTGAGAAWAPYAPRPDSDAAVAADAAARAAVAARLRAKHDAPPAPAPAPPGGNATWPWPPWPPSPPPSVPWTRRDSAGLAPLLPKDVMWLLSEAEAAVANATAARARIATAAKLARLVSAAYCPRPTIANWSCVRCAAGSGPLDVTAVVYDATWDLFAYAGYSHALAASVIAFRGTDSRSIYNWAENMRYWRTDLPLPLPGAAGAMVHTGFFVSWNGSALAPNLTAAAAALVAAHPAAPLYVAGHSLGAALATVAAVDIAARLPPGADVRLVTFGSPRVGNAAFASFVRQSTTASTRVTHNRDIVPSVPPTWVGFHHAATEAWQVDVEGAGVVGLCDATGEDPRCHDSVCVLGLCTSVADHLMYLGAPMMSTGAPC